MNKEQWLDWVEHAKKRIIEVKKDVKNQISRTTNTINRILLGKNIEESDLVSVVVNENSTQLLKDEKEIEKKFIELHKDFKTEPKSKKLFLAFLLKQRGNLYLDLFETGNAKKDFEEGFKIINNIHKNKRKNDLMDIDEEEEKNFNEAEEATDFLFCLGKISVLKNEYDDLKILGNMILEYPNNTNKGKGYVLIAHFFYYTNKDFSLFSKFLIKAKDCYGLAIKHAKKGEEFHGQNGLANIAYTLSDYKRSTEIYSLILKSKPTYHHCLANLGNVYREMGNIKKVTEYFKKVINLHPLYFYGYQGIAQMLSQMELDPLAIQTCKMGLSINPKGTDILFTLANLYYSVGNFQEAKENFEKMLVKFPDHYQSINGLGNIYVDLQEHEKALELYKKALKINPTDRNILFNCADTLYTQKKYQKSIKCYDILIYLDTSMKFESKDWMSCVNHYRNRGMCYYMLREYQQGLMDFYKAKEVCKKVVETDDVAVELLNSVKNTVDYVLEMAKAKIFKENLLWN